MLVNQGNICVEYMPTTQYLKNEALEFLRNHFPVSLHLLLFGTCKARPFGNKMLQWYTIDEKRKTAYSCCWLEQSSRVGLFIRRTFPYQTFFVPHYKEQRTWSMGRTRGLKV